jgi:uncharacterized protein
LALVSHVTKTPFTVPVFDLMHRPGELREKSLDIVVPEGYGNAVIGVRTGSAMHLEARLESLHDGILVSGDEAFDYTVHDDHVDLEPLVRDAVVLALPFQPVCQGDCLGLCPQCGVRLLDNPGHEHEAAVDPRWAALSGLDTLNTDALNTGATEEKR